MTFDLRYRPGETIGGRFRVHKTVMGGMGEVYLGYDSIDSHPYALKTFQQRYLINARIRELFEQEVAIWIALESDPHIVRCYKLEILDTTPFMFLEWVIGRDGQDSDLRSWIQRGPLDLKQALYFAIQICFGLSHANKMHPGIVHRDLKPSNILIEQELWAKITDFGLAKVVQSARLDIATSITSPSKRTCLTRAGNIVGTPPYMPPEQWQGETLDARADIYAVGCILFEMLGQCKQ